ncbi:hypothetical protein DFJ74DRAFT_297846 [Hyaloraphidium curvatum]|nr:hypothetical protein DFJ74DRAFT_297846 [Hyaloraphidium curvatum]
MANIAEPFDDDGLEPPPPAALDEGWQEPEDPDQPEAEEDWDATPVDLSTAAAQPDSPLFKLPPEVLVRLTGWLGPRVSPGHIGWSAANFFYACKALAELGRDVTVQTEFLVGAYGLPDAVLGLGSWLRMASPALFWAIARRAGTVPRYLLQRLVRRLFFASRTDLLAAASAFLAETYPSRSLTPSRSRFKTDDELFRHIAVTGMVPLPHLIREGEAAGWAVESDPALTAMLTLKLRYGVPVALGPGAPSAASLGVFGRLENENLVEWHPAEDGLVPGLDINHALLLHMIFTGRNDAVRRLLEVGVHTTPDQHRTGWVWEAARSIGLWDPQSHDGDDPPEHGVEQEQEDGTEWLDPEAAVARIVIPGRNLLRGVRSRGKVPAHLIEDIIRTLCDASDNHKVYMYDVESLDDDSAVSRTRRRAVTDATEVAVFCANLELTRLLLKHEQETRDRWRTPDGKACLRRCLRHARNNVELYKIVESYAADVDGDRSVDLLAAFMARDAEKAKELAGQGVTLSVSQLVGVPLLGPWLCTAVDGTLQLLILKDGDLASMHKHAILLVHLKPPQLERVLEQLLECANHNGHELPPEGVDRHPAARLLLRAYSALWERPGGRHLLLRLWGNGRSPLSSRICRTSLLRPHLGDRREHQPRGPVLPFDLEMAVRTNDLEVAKELVDMGVKLSSSWYRSGGVQMLNASTSDTMTRFVADNDLVAPYLVIKHCVERGLVDIAKVAIEKAVQRANHYGHASVVLNTIPGGPVAPELRDAVVDLFRFALRTVPHVPLQLHGIAERAEAAGEPWVSIWGEYEQARRHAALQKLESQSAPRQYPSAVVPSISDST